MGVVLRAVRGARLAQQGRVAEGIRDIKDGIAVHQACGAWFSVSMFFAFLAQAYLAANQAQEGLAAVAEGLRAADHCGERRPDAELHRLRGELLLQQVPRDQTQAEAAFYRSLEIARDQEAKSLELRTVTSLARLWQSQGKCKEAHDLLWSIYNWFTEGFDTKDLKEAKALLNELAQE
jgi:predicted ATPase